MENNSHRKREVVAGGSLGHDSLQAPAGLFSVVDVTPTSPNLRASNDGEEALEWN